MAHSVYTIGRDKRADVLIQDPSVSRLHAELVVSGGGMLFLSDRSSSGGTYRHIDNTWEKLRSGELRQSDRIRFGQYETSVNELVARLPASSTPDVKLPSGDIKKVKRDPISGEVIQG